MSAPEAVQAELSSIALLSEEELLGARSEIADLISALGAFGYARIAEIPTQTNVFALPREPLSLLRALRHQPQLFASSAFPALYRRLLRREAALLYPLLFEGLAVRGRDVGEALGPVLHERLRARRILVPCGDYVGSLLRFTPVEGGCLISDRVRHRGTGVEPVWLGADSLDLAEHMRRDLDDRRYGRGLDLCCGSGIQSFTLRRWADEVTGVDLNPRAITMARINAEMLELADTIFRCGDLTTGLEVRFGLIASNAPFVAMPEEAREGNLDAHGGPLGLDLTDRICGDLPRLLEPGGRAYMLTTSPVVRGRDMLAERMRALADAQGFDVLLTGYHYGMPEEYAEHHVAQGIERVICYVTRVENAGRTGFRIEPIRPLRAFTSSIRVRFTRMRAGTAPR